jgi:hypothetical protein
MARWTLRFNALTRNNYRCIRIVMQQTIVVQQLCKSGTVPLGS